MYENRQKFKVAGLCTLGSKTFDFPCSVSHATHTYSPPDRFGHTLQVHLKLAFLL